MELARNKFGPMEDENRRLQDEIDKVREVKQIVIYCNEQLHIDSQWRLKPACGSAQLCLNIHSLHKLS